MIILRKTFSSDSENKKKETRRKVGSYVAAIGVGGGVGTVLGNAGRDVLKKGATFGHSRLNGLIYDKKLVEKKNHKLEDKIISGAKKLEPTINKVGKFAESKAGVIIPITAAGLVAADKVHKVHKHYKDKEE